MKKEILTLLLIALSLTVFGQSTNYSLQLNMGSFSFTGKSAEAQETINYNLEKEDGYTNNPYGSKFGFSYGASVNVTKVTQSKVRFGLDLGYEILRSKIKIIGVSHSKDSFNGPITAKGKTHINAHFINLFPSLGYQISKNSYNLYIDGGLDLGYCLKSTEHGYAKTDTREYHTTRDRKTIDLDIRPRIQIGITRNKIGGYLGYSRGLINYKSEYVGGVNQAYSHLIRFGLNYNLFR